jgi:hypothetical protein
MTKGSDRYNPAFGELNPIEKSFIRPNYDASTSTFLGLVRYSGEKAYSRADVSLPSVLKGIVLRINLPLNEQPANTFVSRVNNYNNKKPLYTINVRIPEIHSVLPIPKNYGSTPGPSHYIINMYPAFVAENENVPLPSIGDIVYVSYGNIDNMSDPIYHGPVYSSPSPGVAGYNGEPIGINSFRPNPSLQGLNTLTLDNNEPLEEPTGLPNEITTYINGEPQEKIEIVEMPLEFANAPNKLVRKEYFDDILKMLVDARAAGHNIRLISGVRTWDQQNYLYKKYLRGEGNLAANPNKTGPSSHLTGKSYDFNIGERYRSSMFTWLALNAHKYGLYNEGLYFDTQPEPWHWSYQGKDSPIVKRYGRLSLRAKRKRFEDYYG